MRQQYITGLDGYSFAELVERVRMVASESPGKYGRPVVIVSLADQVEITLLLLRHNLTQDMVAGLYRVSQATISRVKTWVEAVLRDALADVDQGLAAAARGRVVVVDGTYVPTGNRKQTGKTNYSGKRHCQNLSIQIACDTDGVLLAVSSPCPGARHDRRALAETGWEETLKDVDWFADSGYVSTNAVTPVKKPIGGELSEDDRTFNKQVSRFRSAVERCIAHLKNWKILATGYRRQLKHLPNLIQTVTRLELYRLGW